MSTRTTSYASRSAKRCAVVPPTLPAPTTVIFGRPIQPPETLSAQSCVSLLSVLMFRPPSHFKVDRAHEIVSMIEIHLNFLFSVCLCQKLFWIVYELLITSRRILAEVVKNDDHAALDLLKDFSRTMRKNLPKFGLDHLLRRLRSVFTGVEGLGELGQAANIGILMPREELVQPGGDSPLDRVVGHAWKAFLVTECPPVIRQTWPSGCQALIQPGKIRGKRFNSLDDGVSNITVHAAQIAVRFAVDRDAKRMNAVLFGFLQRGFRVLERILVFVIAVQRPAVGEQYEKPCFRAPLIQLVHRMADRRTVAVLLSRRKSAQSLRGRRAQRVVKLLDHLNLDRPSTLPRIGIECVLI